MSSPHAGKKESEMPMNRRQVMVAGGAVLATATAASALAQSNFPARPVRLVIPYPAGGPTDAIGRLLAQRLAEIWKVAVVPDNRPGAGGIIGAQAVATSPADGYTLLLTAGSTTGSAEVLNPKGTPYRSLRDFSPVMFIGVQPTLMVVDANLPVKDVKEFVALARANPGKYNYATSSTGSSAHFAFNMLKVEAGIDLVEIPFTGAAPANQAFAQGQIQAFMGGVATVSPNLQTGRAKIIGVASAERMDAYPDVPTLREQGFAVEWDTWYGVVAPAGVPTALLDKLSADALAALEGELVRVQLERMGLSRRLGGRQKMADAMRAEIANATRVALEAKMVKE